MSAAVSQTATDSIRGSSTLFRFTMALCPVHLVRVGEGGQESTTVSILTVDSMVSWLLGLGNRP